MTAAPIAAARSLPQRSLKRAAEVDASSSPKPMPNTTMLTPVSDMSNSSLSQLLNVTNSTWLLAIRQNTPSTTIRPRRPMRPATCSRRSVWPWLGRSSGTLRATKAAAATTAAAPRP